MNKNNETLTTFSFEELLLLERGEVKEFATPMPDRKGSLKLVVNDDFGVIDGTMITEKPTQPLAHYNDRPFVEMNFMLQGNISQTYEGLLDKHHYKQGYHNILFNPYSIEKNHLSLFGHKEYLHRHHTLND